MNDLLIVLATLKKIEYITTDSAYKSHCPICGFYEDDRKHHPERRHHKDCKLMDSIRILEKLTK
jgi:hypothetical protein